MPEVRPFKAYMYHPRFKEKMGELISPPYDVLSETDRERLLENNPHNSVRLCLKGSSESYSDLRKIFENWKEEKILQKASENAFYLIEESFEWDGKSQTRVGFVGLLKLSPFEKKEVFPHEYTLKGPKADRLELLKTMKAEFSQIFLCYDDPAELVGQIHSRVKSQSPDIEGTDIQGIARKMWALKNPADIEKIQALLKNKELLIADGHHRYETALHYSEESPSEETAYVQAYFANKKAKGFEILPIHRLCSLPKTISKDELLQNLSRSFQVEKLNPDTDPSDFLSKHRSKDKIQFCLYVNDRKSAYLLSRKKNSETDAEIFALQNEIFQPLFGWNMSEISKGQINYQHEAEDFFEALSKIENSIGFFLPPTDLDVVMQVVKKGERMPQKSTFFYPKIASGLVIYELGS